jgi:hypothetical protein
MTMADFLKRIMKKSKQKNPTINVEIPIDDGIATIWVERKYIGCYFYFFHHPNDKKIDVESHAASRTPLRALEAGILKYMELKGK